MKNYVNLIGRTGEDPELRKAGDTSVVTLSLATNKKIKNKEYTEWHRVVFWGKTAEIVDKYVKKGSLISVDGELRTREYDKDGEKRCVTEVHCASMLMLSSKETPVSETESPDNFPF